METHTIPSQLCRISLLLFALIVSNGAVADEAGDPKDALVIAKTVSKQMMSALSDSGAASDMEDLRKIVDKHLVPHIDFRNSSSLVLAQHWKTADESQRIEFINQFRAFLVRFYTEALGGYVKTREIPKNLISFDDDVEVKSAKQVFVTSHVKQPDGGTVPVVYRMLWNQSWQVIDVSLSGISMVKTYRGNFVSTVDSKGLDELISQLKKRNHELAQP